MQTPSPPSRWLSLGPALCALFVCTGIVIYPLVPASRVTASDPVSGGPMVIQRTHFGESFPFVVTWAAEGYRRHPAARWLPLILLAVRL